MSVPTPRIASLTDACCGCGACAAMCPQGCIAMTPDAAGFLHSQVDVQHCVGCGSCEAVCPVLNEALADGVKRVVWAQNTDAGMLDKSSSGGVFGLLAREILQQGGVVCGAAWDQDRGSVRHVIVRDESDLDSVMRSKYVQSVVPSEVYHELRKLLREGFPVLFSGTACQVAGMRAYLGKLADSDAYLGVDVVCHGVPSPELWRRWLNSFSDGEKVMPIEVNFRSKEHGWKRFCVRYDYGDDMSGRRCSIVRMHRDDWYMRAFLENASVRSSCFACPSKRACGSDLTLADYWGIDAEHPEASERDRGVSAVIANTGKGEAALADVLAMCKWGESSFAQVAAHNKPLVSPVMPFEERDSFMDAFASGTSIETLERRWSFRPTLAQRVEMKLKGLCLRVVQLGRSADQVKLVSNESHNNKGRDDARDIG